MIWHFELEHLTSGHMFVGPFLQITALFARFLVDSLLLPGNNQKKTGNIFDEIFFLPIFNYIYVNIQN